MKISANLKVLPPVAALMLLATVGCGRDSVRVYNVSTNEALAATPPPAAAPAVMPAGGMPATMPAGLPVPDTSSLPALKYTVPAGWQEKPPTQMRLASFSIAENGKQADVSVVPLGGTGGGDIANVNRWRGQVGLQPLTDDDLQKVVEAVKIDGLTANLYDVAGNDTGEADVQRILAAILHRNGTVWFFKVSGESALVEKQKPAFLDFLKSVQFTGQAAATAPMDMSQLPPMHPPIGGMAPGAAAAMAPAANIGEQPVWTVPSDWKTGPLTQFLVAKFIVPGAGEAMAEVNVSLLAGDGGGLQPNVNRWRQQMAVAPASEDELAKLPSIEVPGGKAILVDINGTNPRTGKPGRLVGLILPQGGQTWFYKLMGDTATVAAQKDALINFVKSAKYPGIS